MKSWIILIATACVAWYITDVYSDSPLQTLVAPLLLTAIVIVAICKVMSSLLSKGSSASGADGTGSIDFIGSDNGGDSGS